jgi:arylsulfatase A-like enzyme
MLSTIRSVVRRAVASGPGAGALVLSLFFLLDFVGASLEFMGFSDEKATSIIIHRYGARIVGEQLVILATYAVVGATLGAVGALSGCLWDWAQRGSGSRRRRMLRGVLAALLGHAYFFVRSLVHYPQLYSEAFFDRGGIRRTLMVAATNHLSLRLLDGIAALGLATALVAPAFSARGRVRIDWWIAHAAGALTRRPRLTAAAVALLLVGTGAAVYHRGHGHATRPNVLLIAVDSLRADRVFSADAARRFPTLARLASRGVRFREAHVTVPRTFPSFVTLLTGRFPHHHGIRHMFPTEAARKAIGPALPSTLHEGGYRTAVLSDYAGEIFSRTPLGFDDIRVPYFDMKTIIAQRSLQVHPNVLPYATSALGRLAFPAVDAMPERSDPALLADRAITEIDRLAGKPFFLTVFFSTAHFPYASPSPYYQRFTARAYAGPFRYQKPPLSTATVTPADAAQIRALYDGAVAATDDAIARLLRRLEDDGIARDTIVVLLADHGENLYDVDGRGMGHGDHLEGSSADHVPLVVVDPVHGLAPRDVPAIVRDVDLAPTLAALVGVNAPPGDGVDLGPLLRGERDGLGLDAFSETEFWFTSHGPGFEADERLPYPGITGATDLATDGDIFIKPEWQDTVVVAKHRSIRTERWKLIYRPTRRGVDWRLFDVVTDPDERRDVAAQHPDVVVELRRKLVAWMTSDGRTVMRGDFAVPE